MAAVHARNPRRQQGPHRRTLVLKPGSRPARGEAGRTAATGERFPALVAGERAGVPPPATDDRTAARRGGRDQSKPNSQPSGWKSYFKATSMTFLSSDQMASGVMVSSDRVATISVSLSSSRSVA